jgi:hypothetical protein
LHGVELPATVRAMYAMAIHLAGEQ